MDTPADVEWKDFNRENCAIEMLEAAAETIEAGGSVPVAITLARAGAQFFADRARAVRGSSILFALDAAARSTFGANAHVETFADIVLGPSNAIKHANRPAEPEMVSLSMDVAAMQVFC